MSDDDGTRRPGRPAPRFGEYASSSSSSAGGSSELSEADARIVAEAAEYRRAQAERDAPASAGRGGKKGGKPAAPQTLAEQMAEERKAARERMIAERREAEKAAEAERRQARRAPSPAPAPSTEPGRPGYLPTQQPRRAGRRLDAAVTVGLLAGGGLNLLLSLGSYTDLAGSLARAFPALGISDAYTPTSATGPVGLALLVITVSVFAATVVLSLRRIRRGRVAFWVPLVGAVVATVISAVLLSSLLLADPAFQQFVTSRG
ncbi:hypothetical protein ITJ44_12210 [Clavibacter sp. VKM Ac-2873]|uniref:DUF6264 family protein n=1 Tax=Clavibacter sp. VKM Ac-2873 TaxID=2783813 RepID=UPI00188B9A30|nr:hypothetical protein [Clavibacter sp. VKM Ac-2873]